MTLEPDDVEAIAVRVLALVREELDRAPVRYVDASTLAKALSIDRSWIYAHADELQAVRLGGPNGRLRFDLDLVRRLLHEAPATPQPRTRRRRRRRAKVTEVAADLLPIDP
ncbi:MAG TPA: hypothetical protein VF533_25640 [Solirubrobacteraceae bacterium]|jgi:hypothetical protein